MTMTIDAVFEAGVFRPLAQADLTEEMDLTEGKPVKLTVNAEAAQSFHRGELTEEEMQARLEIVQAINALAVSHGRPETASRDHDQFLYGSEGAR